MHKMRAKSASSSSSSSSSSFDFRSYISRYDAKSETRIQRLLHLARNGINPTAAYGMLERQLKDVGNYTRYREVFGNCPPSAVVADGDCVMDGAGAGATAGANVNVPQEEGRMELTCSILNFNWWFLRMLCYFFISIQQDLTSNVDWIEF